MSKVEKGRGGQNGVRTFDTAEGKHKTFKMAKQMKEERKDVIGARYIQDEHGNIKVEEADIMQSWKRYFSELLNEENQYELEDHLKVEGPVQGVREKEVEEALRKMKRGKNWSKRAEKGLRVDRDRREGSDRVGE